MPEMGEQKKGRTYHLTRKQTRSARHYTAAKWQIRLQENIQLHAKMPPSPTSHKLRRAVIAQQLGSISSDSLLLKAGKENISRALKNLKLVKRSKSVTTVSHGYELSVLHNQLRSVHHIHGESSCWPSRQCSSSSVWGRAGKREEASLPEIH